MKFARRNPLIFLYIVGAVVTCLVSVATYQCKPALYSTCKSDAMVDGYFGGLLWPAYWAFRLFHNHPDITPVSTGESR